MKPVPDQEKRGRIGSPVSTRPTQRTPAATTPVAGAVPLPLTWSDSAELFLVLPVVRGGAVLAPEVPVDQRRIRARGVGRDRPHRGLHLRQVLQRARLLDGVVRILA